MSILSKVKSAAKSVISGAKAVGNTIKSAISGAASSATASAIGAVNMLKSGGAGNFSSAPSSTKPNMTMAPNTSTKYGPAYTSPSGRVTVYGQGGVVNQGASAVANSSSSRGGGSYTSGSSPIYSAPVTIMGNTNRSSLGGMTTSTSPTLGSMSLMSSPSTFSSLSSQSFAPSPSISMPSKPSVSNPGTINNGGLIGALSEMSAYDPNTNSFLPKEITTGTEPVDPQLEGRMKIEQMLQEMIPKKGNIYEDPDIQRQQREVQKRQQEVNNYTAQLNSVVAQQNADLLRLREIGSQEGVTETVYGGQQATINREAAIKALPIQAQIAAAQGNLQLAEDYLTQLTTWKQEAIDNEYTYKKDVYSSIQNFLDKREAAQLKMIEKEDERAYAMTKDFIAEQDYWIRQAITNGQTHLVSGLNNARSREELFKIAGSMADQSTMGGQTMVTQKEAAALNQQIASSDSYKAINKGRDSLQFLEDFEAEFNKDPSLRFVGAGRGNVEAKYNAAILNLKEFFNLGVLNGPDEKILKGILPSPTDPRTLYKGGPATISAGIQSMKQQISQTLDDRYQSLRNQYSSYSPEQIINLKDLDRKYVESKVKVDPKVKQMIQENPNLSHDDVIQVLFPEYQKQSFNSVGGDTNIASIKQAISKIESSNNYRALSPVNRNGERAYGRYQVMASNIPAWTREALGQSLTPQQFLNSPEAQEATVEYQLSKIYQKYGNPDDVAAVWFSGRPLRGNTSTDITGTSVPKYVSNFRKALASIG